MSPRGRRHLLRRVLQVHAVQGQIMARAASARKCVSSMGSTACSRSSPSSSRPRPGAFTPLAPERFMAWIKISACLWSSSYSQPSEVTRMIRLSTRASRSSPLTLSDDLCLDLDFFFFLNYEGSTHPKSQLRRDAKRDCQRQEASCKRAESGPIHITVNDKASEDTFAERGLPTG